jgi:(5-formylfuran-3-yl)methyl phosphate synthase
VACERSFGAFLLDTWRKDGKTLLDHLSPAEIDSLLRQAHAGGIAIALAGSLGWPEIETLLPLAPDYFAVRGAVCREGSRQKGIDRERVRGLSALLARNLDKGLLSPPFGSG